ncbi:TIM-barrel domain-containing protein [Bacteroidota bacterium]
MKPLRLTTITLLTGLLFACTENVKENSINRDFYADLIEQVNSDYFSPLKFAAQQKISNEAVQWEFSNQILKISTPTGKTTVSFAPIEVIYSGEGSDMKSIYSLVIYNTDGSKHIIDSLSDPVISEENVRFSTSAENVDIILQPYDESLKWKVLPAKKELLDSIVINVITEGPFYGGGERYLNSCLNGRTIANQPNDHYWDPPWDTTATWAKKHEPGHYEKYEPTYMQISFFLSAGGQAWYIDDAASVFMTFPESGDQFSVRVESNQTEFYSIHRGTPKEALNSYTAMVGRQPELPDWAVGVWVNLLDGTDSVYAKANRLIEWGIPATTLWIFDMYDIESSQGYQHWTTGTYDNLRNITDSLHNLGFRVLSYLHPYQEPKMPKTDLDNPMYKKLDSLGLLLVTPEQIRIPRYGYNIDGLYNFHIPLMGDLWAEMIQKVLVRDNFDGYMEDFGDLSYCFDRELDKWTVIDYGIETPLSPNQYVNSYPLIYHKLSYLHADAINKDIATFCRSGSAGSAAFTKIVWGGDQMATWSKEFGYPSVISSGISCGLSGYGNWAPDILCNSTSVELWKRWVQFAAFTPILRDHLWVNQPTSIDIWTSQETSEYFKHYAEIHMELVPYIQESLAEYRETGTPMVRHMMLEFPEDPETYFCEYQYMFGPKYLVAPVVEGGDVTKDIYFPKGNWKNYWNSETINSEGEWITVQAPLDFLPVYERIID